MERFKIQLNNGDDLMKNISFSPPDISEKEINNVVEVLKSGWITTGPKTKQFEREIAEFCGTKRAVCLNSPSFNFFICEV